MKAIARSVSGKEYTITGPVVEQLRQHINKPGVNVPIGWVSAGDTSMNFNHIESIRFVTEDGYAN